MNENIRCFLAFDIENEEILRKISSIQQFLLQRNIQLKIVKPENIHITMKFLGNISYNLMNKISNELKAIDFNSFLVEFNGIGTFPNIHHPRVVWIGIKKGSTELVKIFNQIESILQKLGFKQDFREFSPHITIARVKSAKNKEQLINFIKSKASINIGTMRIKYLKLKKSDLTPNGPIYTTIKKFSSKSEGEK